MKNRLLIYVFFIILFIPIFANAETMTYDDAQEAVRQSIQTWYMRGSNRQYNSSKNTYSELRHPEEFTSQDTRYSVCSGFTNDAWMEAFGYKTGSDGIGGRTPAGSTNYCVEASNTLMKKNVQLQLLKTAVKENF